MNKLHTAMLACGVSLALTGWAQEASLASELEAGKALAFDRNKGNCLSCHMMDDGELPGNSGPPLLQMKLRFPDREVLRGQIWDAAERNPSTIMPPYGRHHILTEAEVDLVVDYVHSL
jgi:sulfur-oxidizing protein SoxX